MNKEVKDFLIEWGLDADSYSIDDMVNNFLSEMNKGLEKDGNSSLPMIPTFIGKGSPIVPGQNVIVIDAGGTNLRTCLVTFDDNLKPVISEFKKVSMPGIDKEVSAKEFFSVFANQVEHIIDKSDRIGFCFSYAATITEDNDGIPIVFSKEIKAPEVVGKKVGQSLLNELESRGHYVKNKRIAIVNDTVTTLLAGRAQGNVNYDGYVGFILGTGTNTAYLEDTSKIKKLNGSNLDQMVINVESGSFELLNGKIDELFIKSTKDPSTYHFEKKISGAYLGPMSSLVLHKAIEENVLSQAFKEKFEAIGDVNTTEMSHYLEMPFNKDYKLVKCVEDSDRDAENLWFLLEAIIKRAAKMTAANLASAVLKTEYGKNPLHPVCINADGTTFYKTEYLEKYTKYYLLQYLQEQNNRYVEFVRIENSPVIGAAIAALGLN
ncbi:MAG: hexokinase [Sphaerochaetaceae bacterium]|nr:hexokinase [Sphaerochaetaceae bacterium]MDC7237345.1 hexokinase [Sphaerochaetaceae bacterium]